MIAWGPLLVVVACAIVVASIVPILLVGGQRYVLFRKVPDGLQDFRLMMVLWGLSLMLLSGWIGLQWLDLALVEVDLLPPAEHRWPSSLAIWLAVAIAAIYSLRVYRNHR